MIDYNKEYFQNNCYFFLKDKGETISLYYSVANTLVESRKKDDKKDFDKKDEKKVKKLIYKFLNKKTKTNKKDIEDELDSVAKSGEIDELVDSDGTMLTSKVPILQMPMHPKKTTDQTVVATRVTNDPVTRGYRVYWGENKDIKNDVINEIDFSDAFGYEETKDKDYKSTKKTLKKMGIDDEFELEQRVKQLGKLKKAKVKRDKKDGKLVLKQRLTEKDSLEEEEKNRVIKMVEDILSKKRKNSSDVVTKTKSDSDMLNNNETGIKKIISKNLKSIKKLAEKEGISVNNLINILKSDE